MLICRVFGFLVPKTSATNLYSICADINIYKYSFKENAELPTTEKIKLHWIFFIQNMITTIIARQVYASSTMAAEVMD